ncbi:hypothetical protein [Halobacillus yeomjeoni]|uniref:Uncharacterized protein n=1 Tax=Halobacillus yeomjeoni TaxID=311194 RepID=A0A931MVX3_9BACI|nr:hypothetical protein [Halobacillus yeomjeoni]MBH0231102.1 hypothetical protein [Halobacillus yeomjeoni]
MGEIAWVNHWWNLRKRSRMGNNILFLMEVRGDVRDFFLESVITDFSLDFYMEDKTLNEKMAVINVQFSDRENRTLSVRLYQGNCNLHQSYPDSHYHSEDSTLKNLTDNEKKFICQVLSNPSLLEPFQPPVLHKRISYYSNG